MGSVTRTERVLSSSFFFVQDVNVSFEDAWCGQWSRFGHNQTSVHLFSGQTSDQNTNIVTGLSVIEGLVEGFNTDDLGFEFASVSVEFDLFADFDLSLFDCAWSYNTSTGNVVSTFNWHHERFVDGSLRNWDQSVHGVEELLDSEFSQFWVCVLNGRNGGTSDESCLRWVVLVFFQKLFQLFLNEVDHFSVFDHVHLV